MNKINCRQRYLFDDLPETCHDGWKFARILSFSPDRTTFYVECGNNSGVRFAAHTEDGKWYVAPGLHTQCFVEVEDPGFFRAILARVASNVNGILPLDPISDLPGFSNGIDDVVYHKDGWFTRTVYARRLPGGPGTTRHGPLALPEDATRWDIAEGVYVVFTDGSYRLIPRRDYYGDECAHTPVGRQGDFLMYGEYDHPAEAKSVADAPFSIDRHSITRRDDGSLIVTHPEHGEMPLPSDAFYVRLLPGSSRPFSRGYGAD